MLRDLLGHPEVTEVCELRNTFGLMAFHGGNLERCTDVIATEVAERTDASLYAIIQAPPLRRHIPSTAFDPAHSPALAGFVDHVDVVIAIHGYGREDRFWDVLLGGRNRALATHVGDHLRGGIDERFGIIDRLDDIPKGLRGQHADNPVNLPTNAGVQIELPPTTRWNREEAEWSDWQGTSRAPQVEQLIEVLSKAVSSWPL
ncbi:MAG: poly-gamma-glutamate hydrolase family protein [Acidimicrobiales bacterium]